MHFRFFFFYATPTAYFYTLSLHDALPILVIELRRGEVAEVILNNLFKQTQLQTVFGINMVALVDGQVVEKDRKSTRLNSSHVAISYAVFCLIKKISELS